MPAAMVVPVGTTVRFPNQDTFFHNVFSYSGPARFDLGRYPRGESKDVRFDEAGIVKVYCEVHEFMRAVVVVTADANPNAAGVAPVLINGRGNMELDVMHKWERHHHKISCEPDGPFCTWFLTGAVVLWRLPALRDIGGFDEDIFLYNEDTDLCMRATQKGYSLIVEPEAKGDHFGGRSEDLTLNSRIRRDRNMMWGHLMYERKYAGAEEADKIARRELGKCCADALAGLLTLRVKKLLTNIAKGKAAYSFLKGGSPWGR